MFVCLLFLFAPYLRHETLYIARPIYLFSQLKTDQYRKSLLLDFCAVIFTTSTFKLKLCTDTALGRGGGERKVMWENRAKLMSIELPLVMGIWNALLVVASIVVVLTAGIKIVTSASWYKKRFAQSQNEWANLTRRVFDPLKRKLFSDLEQHLRSMEGDVLEIGIGPGSNFDYYPQGTSLIAVDSNPHVEESLKRNLEKACRKIYLKKFVAASAEDMSCKGEIGVEDNSVAAVVCAKLLCNLSDLQMRKTIAEVKRVLMPVSLCVVVFSVEIC